MHIEKILFLDVETVSQTEYYSELHEDVASLWEEKYHQIKNRAPEKYAPDSNAENCLQDMGLFAEFGRIACISIGFVYTEEKTRKMRLKSFFGDNEKLILEEFANVLQKSTNFKLCGHNIREFDVPYIARRMIINDIPLPKLLLNARKKQWESPVIDTMEMWKFGDYKHYTSLKLLCNALNIKSPKENMEGKDVYHVFYQEKDFFRISHYCEKDVIATIQVFLKLNGEKTIDENNIEIMPSKVISFLTE